VEEYDLKQCLKVIVLLSGLRFASALQAFSLEAEEVEKLDHTLVP
jgi:hypothetical protein